tara:strand:- start:39 stop:320 length:282 start_codon:yes stop_codon:yes gene_type:complete
MTKQCNANFNSLPYYSCFYGVACVAPCSSFGEIISEFKKASIAARKFVKRFGNNAPAEAKRRAQEMQLFGRAKGYAAWKSILEEVEALINGGE